MYKVRASHLVASAIILWMPLYVAAAAVHQDVKEIRKIYKFINDSIQRGATEEILFHTGPVDYGPYDNKAVTWQKVEHPRQRKYFDNSDYKARVYYLEKKIRKVVFQNIGEGWNSTVEYYSYPNGRMAFVFEKLDTLHGYDLKNQIPLGDPPFIVEKRTYYRANGQIIRVLEKAFRKKDGTTVPLEFLRRSVMMDKYYESTLDLPFAEKSMGSVIKKFKENKKQ